MQNRRLGPAGIEASVVAFGAWAVGGWMWGGSDERAAVRAIHAALDAGITFIDTAPVYGFGVSEEVVGKAIRGRRDQVVLATKCGLIWHEKRGRFHFAADAREKRLDGPIEVFRCLSPDAIRHDVETSLRRLGTDHIDLLQTHWQDPTTPISRSMETLLRLKEAGKIRSIGCSNASLAQMDAYRAAGQLDVDQEPYSMLDRRHAGINLPYCASHGLAFLAYSPLAQGLLTGKIGPKREFAPGDQRRRNPRFSPENRRRVAVLLDAIRPVAAGRTLSLAQVALAWTLAQPGCTHVLAGARTPEQAEENAVAGSVVLDSDELDVIDQAVHAFEAEAAN